MTNKEIGKYGENLAKNFLTKRGFEILEMNYKYSRLAEIDIIAKKDNVIHFVEVKTRTGMFCGHPFEAINSKKLQSIFMCGQYYLKANKAKFKSFQIDVIGIIIDNKQEVKDIQIIENIALY